jgi:DNA topoisomerase-1
MPPKFYKKKFTTTKPGSNQSSKPMSSNLATAKYLIIVESPSKCAKIEHFLGDDYCCIASKGHIRSIEGLKAIDTKKSFEPTFTFISEKERHIENMRKTISMFSKPNIILASDDDREGEAISWHICKIFDLPIETTKRIIFHEVTKNAIIDAVKKPTLINMNLVQAQHARQVLDIIVGYKISPYLWKYLYNNKSNSLSAGRCQTPALRLVYDNEKEKETSKTEQYYKTRGVFFSKSVEFHLNNEFSSKTDVLDFLDKSKTHNHMLKIDEDKQSIKSPPRPFHTSRLLQVASNVLHMSPKTTMEICQKLYQNGYITYMRTESSQYSTVFLENMKTFIIKEYKKPEYIGNLGPISLKDTTNPHEAIRVTQIETRTIPNAEDTRMISLYKLIWKNTIESCMADAIYKCKPIKISAPLENEYLHTIEIPIFYGWKILSERSIQGSQNDNVGLLTFFQSISDAKKPCPYQYIESEISVKNKHQHYTEASLINKLEDLGIGRPSTFASIVETIQDRGYVKKTDIEGEKIICDEYRLIDKKIETTTKERIFGNEKKKLVIQSIGIVTVEFLLKYFEELFSYEYTKTMEEQLDIISSNDTCEKIEWSTICKECYDEIKRLSGPIKNIKKQSYPLTEPGYEYIFERFGPAIKHTLEDGTIEYLPAKKDQDIDLEKLKNKEYTLNDLLEIKNSYLGKYEGEDIFIKTGRYGPYVEYGKDTVKRESIKEIEKPLDEITLADITEYLGNKKDTNEKTSLRVLNSVMCIKKGKFGPYVFYKRPDMKKPEFLNIKKFPEGFLTCETSTIVDWLCEKYKLPDPN